MWELINQFNREAKLFSGYWALKRNARLVLNSNSFITASCLFEKTRQIRLYGASSIADLCARKDDVGHVVLDMCPVFSLPGAQTKIVEDSLLLSNTKFYLFLAPKILFSNGESILVGFSVAQFITFFTKFLKTRNLIFSYCQIYNKSRKVCYKYHLILAQKQLRPVNFLQDGLVALIFKNTCAQFFRILFFFFLYYYYFPKFHIFYCVNKEILVSAGIT